MTDRIPGVMADTCVRLFGRGEAFDSEGFISFFTDKPMYQFGNGEPCLNKGEIFDSVANFFAAVDALYHDVRNVWEHGDVVFVEMDVMYWRKDGTSVTLPASDIFRFEGHRIQELRIFMDANPIFDPSLPVGRTASVFTASEGRRVVPPGLMKKYFTEHAEGVRRAANGYPPKWSLAGPRWPLNSDLAPLTSDLAPATSDLAIERIFHFNINCTDLERTVPFYEMLGFKVILDFGDGMESREMADAFGMDKANIKGVHLRLGDGADATRIDLLEFQDPAPYGQPYPHLYHTGIARMCLKTTDIWQMYDYLKSQGVEFLSEPQLLPGTDVTIVCFKDPDGTFIELLEGDF
ncbi:MAG: VOC family protein [Deltaproteobacteria bacterium]|nr:VOC family protein [Deltaproteobacteria bacterium]